MTLPLTPMQEKLWRFMLSCDRAPTFAEMAKAMGHSCRGAAEQRVAEALISKGYAKRVGPYGSARSIIAVDPTSAPDIEQFSTAQLAAELARRLAA